MKSRVIRISWDVCSIDALGTTLSILRDMGVNVEIDDFFENKDPQFDWIEYKINLKDS